MLKLFNQCFPWLDWQVAGLIALVIAGLALCLGLPTWSILAGATPLLVIAACLLPCLIPLIWLRRKNKA